MLVLQYHSLLLPNDLDGTLAISFFFPPRYVSLSVGTPFLPLNVVLTPVPIVPLRATVLMLVFCPTD